MGGKVKRLKVLISAYACEPAKGSEPGVGWNVAREMARHHEVWVLTRANNCPSIEAELSQNPVPGLHFSYYDLPKWATWWKSGGRGVQVYYYLWQLGAYLLARKLHRKIGFDLAHHVTFVKYWAPSFLSQLPIPFIWGPVGGGESAPKVFWGDFSRRGRRYERLRDIARWLGEHDPLVRLTARKSSIVLATTPETEARVRALGAPSISIRGESGLQSDELCLLSPTSPSETNVARFVSIGRLLHWKGYHLGITAFAQAQLPRAQYWLIGDGPERRDLEVLAAQLGVSSQVVFCGQLHREATLEILSESMALIHPSLHDSGGWVCLEAMAASKPVICLKLGGPAVQVTPETGFVIPAKSPSQAIREMSEAIRRLAEDEALRTALGRSGQRRIREEFTWDKKVNVLKDYYASAIRGKA